VDAGSREENASKRESGVPFRFGFGHDTAILQAFSGGKGDRQKLGLASADRFAIPNPCG
jgi:hypothetical protein